MPLLNRLTKAAAHKAASPIRFPPTVILTPIVAKMIGKEPNEGDEEEAKA
jgi:uncharacterized protein (DUF697 family)